MQILRYTFFIMLLYSFNVSAMHCPENVTNSNFLDGQNEPATWSVLLGRKALNMMPTPAKKANVHDNIIFVNLSITATVLFYVYVYVYANTQ